MVLEDLLNPINRPAIVHCDNRGEIEDLKKFLMKNCDAFNETTDSLGNMFAGVYNHLADAEYMNKCSFSFDVSDASHWYGNCGFCDRRYYEVDSTFSQWSHYEYSDLVVAEINYDDFAAFLLEE